MKQIQMTKEGSKSLKAELDKLVNEKRPRLVERLANARSQGDLTENSDYSNAKEELEFLDGRISELENVLKTATVVSGNHKKDGVAVGTKITVKVNGQKHVWTGFGG
ncbi:MAG: Transcription elongation factor GreA [Candidatus Curtissbacteria bacterium GW2011_GWC1_44_33]|uniref:Transcription elongation factor GreA n=1 Tax=Candidatus Curtissbacteria bacterium GW2011_GWC1_44_33 TaxID=1618413 RepID=A0A0G1M421_9BACT|nr:MAG: Transcription elongation factor GreA [Candidatus Curtissbacteria bacterium GW2011_GWC1_44_33]